MKTTIPVVTASTMTSDNLPFFQAMKQGKIARLFKALSTGISLFVLAATAHAQFVHPGCLSTQGDLDRMKAKVDTNAQPWKAGYDRLVAAPYGQLGHTPSPQTILYASGSQPDNYITLARDAAAAYQVALRYHASGDPAYAAKAVSILMAWANTHTGWNGNTNVSLRAGLYGYQLACAGELVRNYSGWAPADFAKFQSYVRTQFYKIVSPNDVDRGFLFHHHGTCWSHYWANWEMAAMSTVIATGVLCDDEAIFQEGIDYFYNGVGVGRISELLHYLHPNGLGQSQEFGRDQGHATMLVPLLGTFCEIAWNQGVDLYSELDDAFLALSENLAKYNLWYDTPYVPYINCEYVIQTNIGSQSRGSIRAGMDLIYNHYVNRMGLAAPYTKEAAESIRPEGGGGQYGPNSGGFDQLGFTTLTHSLDPIASGAVPSQLRAHVKGGKITLSWRGSAYAKSYNVKRATTPGGPYINLAAVGPKNTTYIDTGIPPGTTCYYVVSANNPGGESAPSVEISAVHGRQLDGTVIGTDGSAGNWGATKGLAMDGSLRNFMDAWAPDGGWVGLDLGAGVSAVITAVKYCPQPGGGNRLVGGVFEGSNTADFSNAVNLFTVTTAPPSEVFTSQSITNGNTFRYVRFRAPANNYCTLSEVQFIGNVTGMTPPAAAPTGLAVTSPWLREATLTWNSVPGTTEYVIKRATSPSGPYNVVDYNAWWDTDYTDRKLAAGTYYYVVSALNSVGESTHSSEVSILIPVQISSTAAAPPIDGADIYHLPGAVGEAAAIDGDGSSSGTNDESTYVTAGRSSKGQTFTTGSNPAGYTLRSFTFQHVNWPTWVNNGTFYDVQFGDTFEVQFGIMSGTTKTPLHTSVAQYSGSTITGSGTSGTGQYLTFDLAGTGLAVLAPNTTYYCEIASEAGDPYLELNSASGAGYTGGTAYRGDTSDPGMIASGVNVLTGDFAFHADIDEVAPSSADTTSPATPAGLIATGGDGTVTLDWADNTEPDVARYTVYRSTTSGGPYTAIATGLTFSNYSDTTATNGATYYHYVVTATDTALNESVNSAEASAQVENLHLHLKFDETNGTTAADSSGNGRHTTLVNGSAFAPGKIDNALAFTGSSSRYATLPAGIVSTLNDFTISTWVNPTSLENWARVFDFGSGTSTNMFFTAQNGANGKPRLAIKINNSAEQIIDAPDILATGVWTHLAVTLSGNTGTLYINGVAVGTNNAMTFKPSGMGNTTQNYLGKSQYADPYFNGALDDFRIYSSALSAGDIGILAAGQLTAPQNVTAAPGKSQIALSWNAVSGATNYTIRRSSNSEGPFTDLATGVATTTYMDSGLTDGTTWHYTVAAHGLPGTGPASVPASATTYTTMESWRFSHFGTPSNNGNAADSADPDGDGMTNAQEYLAGTDPMSGASALRVSHVSIGNQELVVNFSTVSGKTYRLERSDTLQSGSWETVQGDIAGTGGVVQATDANGAAQAKRFYRVVVVP